MPIARTSQTIQLLGRPKPIGRSVRWSSVALAMVLAACVHSPQAAVQDHGVAMPRLAMATARPGGQECRSDTAAHGSLKALAMELKAQGMALKTACRSGSGGLQVQLQVVDGMKASKWVRGPLADGQDVDMGTPSGIAGPGAAANAKGFSPDVLHNRVWLSELMARHQFENQPDAWWHFSQRLEVAPDAAETDLASR